MDLNKTDLESLLQISTEQDTLGFDLRAGTTWIYPTNYPIRDYQYNIVQSALYKNTLVSLPTGLGKTFIAAVIMYNFYRWYPTGKIIFMAPTKPLVRQQIDACYNIMAIPPEVTSEMTGAKITASRVNIWKEKRVFFITPHILQNDLETIPDLGPKIRCVVIDEAHKALGRQANCEVIRKLKEVNTNFRVLALSATPGSNFKNITEVISNLLISHIECRTDESIDVAPYVFNRQLETVVVPLGGMLQNIKEQYLQILDHYTRPLIKFNVLSGNCAMMTKGKILLTMRDYKDNCRDRNNYRQIMCNFTICITLYHGYELLIRHGLRSFLTFFEANIDKPLINSINNLRDIINEVRDYLGPTPTIDILPDGTIPDIPEETKFGHPKFYKLADVLSTHFQNADNSTRAMVFCEYRESVNEAYMLLLKHRPVIRPKIFIGKGTGTGRGQTQAQQLLAIKMFREGKCNTLIATCIGEEGIDVGEVDLIICFDISTKSPVRMVQRMGRTGRKRNGRVVILVTEGREQQTLQECLIQKSCMNNLLNSNHISNHFYDKNPRMIPDGLKPSCTKIHITVPKKNEVKKAKNTVKNMFDNLSSTQSSTKTETEFDITNICELPEFNHLPESFEFWTKSKENLFKSEENYNRIFGKRLEKQLHTHNFFMIGHSIVTESYVSLLKFSDKKKYNLPTTQSKNISQRPRDEPLTASQVNNFVQVDIRNMFRPRVPKIPVEIENDIDPPLYDIISSINNYIKYDKGSESCEICLNFFPCTTIYEETKIEENMLWVQPDYSVIDNLNPDSLTAFLNTLKSTNLEITRDDTKEKSKLSETLEFFKLNDLESIFNDEFNEPSTNDNILLTPPKIYKDVVEVSPVLFSTDRVQSFQNKLKRLSQASQEAKCRKSFDFNKFEKFNEECVKNSEDRNNSSAETECYDYDALNNSREIFEDDEVIHEDVNVINRTVEDVIVNNMNYNSDEMDVFFDNLEVYERYESKTNETTNKTTTVQDESKKCNDNFLIESVRSKKCNKNDDILNESVKDLRNIETMFDVGDLSLFDSSGDTKNEKPVEKTTVENPLDVDFDIGDEFIFESDNEDDNNQQTSNNKPVENQNIKNNSPILNDQINSSTDSSHFYSPILNYNIEPNSESNSPILTNYKSRNKTHNSPGNKTISNEIIQFSPILSKLLTKNKINSPAKSNYFDPDETILISSDDETDFIQSPKLSNKKINLTKLKSKLRVSQSSSQMNKSINSPKINKIIQMNSSLNKSVDSPINKSIVNQTNSSLLSVTQILNLINDESVLDSSLKENEVQDEVKNLPTVENEVKNLSATKKPPVVVKNQSNVNKPILSEKSINKIEDKYIEKILGNSQSIRRESTPKNLNKKFSFFQNDLSDFEFTLSTPKCKSSQVVSKNIEKSQKIDSKSAEKLKTNEDEILSKIVWDDLDDFEIPTQKNKQNIKEKIEERKKNESPIDWIDEDSLLKFSYTSPWKKNSNEDKISPKDDRQNTKNNRHVNKINRSLSKSPVSATQDSPIKFKRNVVRKIALSDSDDDFEEKDVFKKPFTTPRKEPTTSKINLKRLQENKTDEPCKKKKVLLKLKEKRKVNNPFIQDEAEIEDDEEYTSDSGDSEDIDALESSFIADSQMNLSPEVDMHAKYLQSVRSPIMKHGGFKIPQRISRSINVFSQTEDMTEENTYVQDSFCVDTESTLKFNDDLSYLERAEMEIERQRKKKRKRSEKSPKKRKRVIQCFSDSD